MHVLQSSRPAVLCAPASQLRLSIRQRLDGLTGRGLVTPAVNGEALRSMKSPGAGDGPIIGGDPRPAHMRDFVRTYDNGGVHRVGSVEQVAVLEGWQDVGVQAFVKAA